MKTDSVTPQDSAGAGSSLSACSAVFVVVMVSYDYYRFQDNLGATTDLDAARAIAARESESRGYDGPLPIIEDAVQSSNMDSPETRHIWIEVFLQNKSDG
jgi:hypothetical protein